MILNRCCFYLEDKYDAGQTPDLQGSHAFNMQFLFLSQTSVACLVFEREDPSYFDRQV